MQILQNSAKLIGGDNKPKVKVVRPRRRLLNKIPNELLNNPALKEAMTALPSNYNFELYKSIWRVQILRDKFYKDNNNTYHDNHKESEDEFKVALQFPEGLLMYSCVICDILNRFTGAHVFILGDVTYGACCIDDFTASKLGAHFLIHYGHSCLVPVNETRIDVLYVFVELSFDIEHVVNCIVDTFPIDTKLAIMGTIQFGPAVYQIATKLKELSFSNISIPQAKPLSMGETLGCTSPILSVKDYAALVFIADGRFHLESAMIQNPDVKAYRYDPYGKSFTIEGYDTEKMKKVRWSAIMAMKKAKSVGVILGTLGRQGNPHIFDNIR